MNTDMILINSSYGLTKEMEIDLKTIAFNYSPIQLRKDILDLLVETIHSLDMDNDLALVSGYRSLQSQIDTWNYCLNQSGLDYTRQYVAKPGHSEHHTGLAIDIGSTMEEIDYIAPILYENDKTNAFKQILYDSGFILRYPLSKEAITGISHEPWHFRYIGKNHSRYVMDHDLCYEEYIDLIKAHDQHHPLWLNDHIKVYSCNHEIKDHDGSTISYVHEGFYVITEYC